MKTINKRRKLNYRVVFIILGTILFLSLGLTTLFYNYYQRARNVTFYITDVGTIKYRVCLKENNLFTEECLGEGREYLTAYIDYIEIDIQFLRDFSSNFTPVDINYKYTIDAMTVISTENGKVFKDVFDRLISKFDTHKKDVNTEVINESIRISFDEYASILEEFKIENRSARGDLRIVFSIDMTIIDNRLKPINKSATLSINIPMGNLSTHFEVASINNEIIEETQTISSTDADLYNILWISFASLSGIILLLILYINRLRVRRLSPYERFMREINSKYGEKITMATKDSIFDDKEYQIIDVEDFNELFEQAMTLSKNIVITKRDYITDDRRYEVAWATVIDDKMMYRKIYKEIDEVFK